MRKQTPIEKELESAVYTTRLLVLLESEQGFRQVLLTKEQFKRMSDAVCTIVSDTDPEGMEDVEIRMSEDTVLPIELFEGMLDFE